MTSIALIQNGDWLNGKTEKLMCLTTKYRLWGQAENPAPDLQNPAVF